MESSPVALRVQFIGQIVCGTQSFHESVCASVSMLPLLTSVDGCTGALRYTPLVGGVADGSKRFEGADLESFKARKVNRQPSQIVRRIHRRLRGCSTVC